MASKDELAELMRAVAAQVDAYEKRKRSRAEIYYGDVMRESATTLAKISRTASFDQLIMIEKVFQQNDLAVYANVPSTLKTVQQGIDDLLDGEAVYRQLIESPQAYKAHKYRESERASPDKLVPLDAMRRALRGQAKRVENYRKNVMGNPHEYAFFSARITLLHRAEKLYDGIQSDRLLSPESNI